MATAGRKRARANRRANGAGGSVVVLTRDQLVARAERAARDLLKVSRVEAFKRLDQGKLRGTLAEAVLTPMRDLLAD